MQQLKENNLGLPDFVTMTNYCEDKGYEIELIRSRKGVTCDVYKEKELLKSGGPKLFSFYWHLSQTMLNSSK